MHVVPGLKVLYFGTPVVLISSRNADGSTNLAPMSSAWWLGQSCMLGLGNSGQTTANLLCERECVLNLPSSSMVDAVDRIALTTGKSVVPEHKVKQGYRYEPDKFSTARLTEQASELVRPPRVAECPIQLECRVVSAYPFGSPTPSCTAFQVEVLRAHVEEKLVIPGTHYVDPIGWDPLIMKFCEFFGGGDNVHPSRLADGWGMPHDLLDAIGSARAARSDVSAMIGSCTATGGSAWHACPVKPEQQVDLPKQRAPQHVRIAHLTAPVFRALVNGDLAAANAVSPVPLSAYFAGSEWRGVWQRRSKQVEEDPASAAWVTGVIWDERQQVAVGRAGYHGPPDPSGMVEIGYAVDPAYRRRGYARAALEALLQRAAREPQVHTVRVTISPDNVASRQLASQYGFTEVGEQWDDEDGLEIIYEVDAQRR